MSRHQDSTIDNSTGSSVPRAFEGLPPYSFVPGGPWPHPLSSPQGHSYSEKSGGCEPIVEDHWRISPTYLRGVALFNAGYYWEAHEAWESLWHAHNRKGPIASVFQALIKLAASGVKVRQQQPHGIVTHALRAAALFESTRKDVGPKRLGLDLDLMARFARGIAAEPKMPSGTREDRVFRVFSFEIEPED